MARRNKRLQILLFLLVVAIYGGALIRNRHESKRRSLMLKETPIAGDHVSISLEVVNADTAALELTTRMSFRLEGTLASDPVTPAVDLTLFLNGIRGPQQIEFPRGRRINVVEAVFSLDGNANKYPFDTYGSSIWMMVTRKAPPKKPPAKRPQPAAPATASPVLPASAPQPVSQPTGASTQAPAAPPEDAANSVLVAAPQEDETLPVSSGLAASIPGLKFQGQSVHLAGLGWEGFNLTVRRADNVVMVSTVIMVLMMGIALSVFLMSSKALASDEKIELLPLSLCVTLLFGLPALRNTQPAVPPLGVFGDYLSFIWAEMIVAASAVIFIWTWLLRKRQEEPASSKAPTNLDAHGD